MSRERYIVRSTWTGWPRAVIVREDPLDLSLFRLRDFVPIVPVFAVAGYATVPAWLVTAAALYCFVLLPVVVIRRALRGEAQTSAANDVDAPQARWSNRR